MGAKGEQASFGRQTMSGHTESAFGRRGRAGWVLAAGLACALAMASGCSVRRFAIENMAGLFSEGAAAYASDKDPELIREAMPFSLKLIEGMLNELPDHRELLLAACSGFTQYAYVFLDQEADEVESGTLPVTAVSLGRFARPIQIDTKGGAAGEPAPSSPKLALAADLRTRSRGLYLRARDYGLRGLDAAHPGFWAALARSPKTAVQAARKDDVPLLYWTAAAWGSAIAISKEVPDLVADQIKMEALIDRALELDESYDHGAIHGFLITYERVRQGAAGSPESRIRPHFERAVELSNGQLAMPMVAYAESVSLQQQNRQEFEAMLRRALAISPDARPEWRLVNLVAQRRARWLLSRIDDLF